MRSDGLRALRVFEGLILPVVSLVIPFFLG